MIGFLSTLFSSGVVNSVTKLASEAIETDMESAEAKALFIKTLDPNGMMRRQLSNFASSMYGFYLISTVLLMIMHFFGIGDAIASKNAIDGMKDLFTPITTAWGGIVAASFGVNASNVFKGK